MSRPTPQQRDRHSAHRNAAAEFSWGRGHTPVGLEDAPPSQGGRYRGISPKMVEPAALAELRKRVAGED